VARRHWLVKSEPSAYPWDRFAQEGSAVWDGVKNPQARSNLSAMQKGDLVLFYHSGEGKDVVGVARVTREAYPDPKGKDPRQVVVDLAPVKPLAKPVTLAQVKADPSLSGIALVRQSRLSVMELPKAAFDRILALGDTKL
jgi:predicted RNA-binding protein with PUA-like domain